MKTKNLSIVAGLFAFSLSAIPFAANANVFNFRSRSDSQTVAQAQPVKKNKKAYSEKFAQELGLTDSQKSQLAQIRQNTKAEIDKVLTPEQRQQRQAAYQNREGRRNGKAKLNLSDAQKAQIKQIMQSSKAQMDSVLTPEQKQKLEQLRQNRGNRRQQRQGQ
ncbi:P pilus assembly/Cpx signaling pathway, periplasmic inhibitor/zinc-resistance associated protein [Calothrix sp. UHCC 0171]|uniref:Spy/CpxP family protein refolding chaperone n=1 Tax=Calothrix sp. UHCC 0171 TaxID=3110245 RepID=UPI002B206F37|nr:P pilus assembly/Cpx signaling pathway, periplasmic inhibitor/zinc-resistance associated protein [Calothrix sp. UHCC 0171]MEA5569842.1 P pilus assembly/Cpx signaling pathway, periplasmic inhibitor/zinc-resistance associated protein [Calothrix sp. UHCC 0171]